MPVPTSGRDPQAAWPASASQEAPEIEVRMVLVAPRRLRRRIEKGDEVWLRRPEARIAQLNGVVAGHLGEEPAAGLLTTLETEYKYAGYMTQQARQIERLRESEDRRIPTSLEFRSIPGLSREVAEKLHRVRPGTLGQAGRIPGVTPAAVAVLEVYMNLSR